MIQLKVFNIAHNGIAALPASLGGCTELEEIDATDNNISTIPNELSHLLKLKSLLLDQNNVHQVPTCVMTECVALQTISLHGNPITLDQFQETPGYAQYEVRARKSKLRCVEMS